MHIEHLAERLARGLSQRSQRMVDRLDRTGDRLSGAIAVQLAHSGSRLTAYGAQLDALSPLKILARGYAVARDERGGVLKRVQQFPAGREFRLRVTDGEIDARVR